MNSLTIIALMVGTVLIVLGGLGLFVPETLGRALTGFPRHRASAILLTLVNVLWVAWILYSMSLGRFEWVKAYVWLIAPGALLAIIFFMDELLAPRMLGGFLLLAAGPALDIARWNPSGWRLVLTTLVYVWIVWAMILVLSPYRFRHTVEWVLARKNGAPLFGGLLGLGALLVVLAVAVY